MALGRLSIEEQFEAQCDAHGRSATHMGAVRRAWAQCYARMGAERRAWAQCDAHGRSATRMGAVRRASAQCYARMGAVRRAWAQSDAHGRRATRMGAERRARILLTSPLPCSRSDSDARAARSPTTSPPHHVTSPTTSPPHHVTSPTTSPPPSRHLPSGPSSGPCTPSLSHVITSPLTPCHVTSPLTPCHVTSPLTPCHVTSSPLTSCHVTSSLRQANACVTAFGPVACALHRTWPLQTAHAFGTEDRTNSIAPNSKALCLMYGRDLATAVRVLEDQLQASPLTAVEETVVLNLCSMYNLAASDTLSAKSTLSNWLTRLAPDDCTRL
ncbi:unnamed protein product [Closterium sp. Naga37s-1]|nr:unnamed protein product [Closterium sp. Naga37s-1]